MEDRSELENYSDKVIHILLKKTMDEFGSEFDFNHNNPPMEDSDFISALDSSLKLLGNHNGNIEDINYISSLILLNDGYDFSSDKPTSKLKRPQGFLYTFDVDEHRTEYVRRTHKVDVFSYDEKLVFDTFRYAEGEGVVSYYDYPETDTDYYDGETTDVNYDRASLRKIK
jgi:hypothetical protein